MRIALCQRRTYVENKQENIRETKEMLKRAMDGCNDVDLVMFPELNYGDVTNSRMAAEYAETMDGAYITLMRELAAQYKVNLIPGSFLEKAENGRYYNAMPFIDRQGKVLEKYQKIHLADLAGAKESAFVEAGKELKLVDTEFGKVGLMVCYDMRFPEQARSLTLAGADLICSVACWPMGRVLPTRLSHWDTLTKATALYNLTYFATCNCYGEVKGNYPFGCSRVVNPWGDVIADCSSGTKVTYADIDFEYQKWARQEIATLQNRRPDVYQL